MKGQPEYCASCKAPVLSAESPSGARVILDPDPIPTGTIVFLTDGRVDFLNQRARATVSSVVPRYQAHAVSCPQRRPETTAPKSTPKTPRLWESTRLSGAEN
jgi:hypothetical protein